VNVSAKQRTNISVEISYFAQGASWHPVYDIRAKDVKSPVSLLYKAMVNQSTGENWENVRVALSTGNPSLGGTKPQLQPWFLRFYEEQVYQLQSIEIRDKKSKARYEAEDLKASPGVAAGNIADQVVMNENQLVTEFEIQIPYTVMSNAKPVMMDIQSHSLPASYSYFSAPKFDKDAFLAASITGWEKLNLLPGTSNVYLENTYVGEAFINPVTTTDTLLLSFGRDKRIVIKRERIKDLSTTKFIGGNVVKEFIYETTIKNTKKEHVSITIEDQFPLTTDASIKIEIIEKSNGNYTPETGMINWKLELKPGETKKLKLGYSVKYPKDKMVSGL
jgi:uncharacterized protein (TIGR02231 family)